MIEINLIEKKKKFKAPVVLGIDFGELPWKTFIVAILINQYVPPTFKEQISTKRKSIEIELGQLRRKQNTLNREVRSNQNIEELLKAFNQKINKLKERTVYIDKIIKERTNPRMILEKLARSTPEQVWFNELKINGKKEVLIKGGSNDYKSIGDFIVDANSSPFFKGSLQLANSKTINEKQQGVDIRVESFEIKGQIKLFNPFQ